MKMLKSIAVLSLFLISCTTLFAQEDKNEKTPEERAAKMTDKMSAEYGLDEKTTAELKAINVKFASDMKRIKSDGALDQEQKKAQIKEIHDAHKVDLKNILTEEQFARYEQMEAEKMAEHQEKQGITPEERAARRTAHIKEVCNLNAEQEYQVSELNKGVEQKIEVIRNDASMSDDRKKEFIRGNRKDQMNTLKDILTPEQLELLKAEKHKYEDQ